MTSSSAQNIIASVLTMMNALRGSRSGRSGRLLSSGRCWVLGAIAVLLGLAPAAAAASAVRLEWNPNTESDLAGYRIYRGTVSGGPYARIGQVPAPATVFTEIVLDGPDYFYVATAYDLAGNESRFSNEVHLETITRPSRPSGGVACVVGRSCGFRTGGASSSSGHNIRYRFLWSDGMPSDWLPVGTTTASRSWASPGVYTVRAEARCATHGIVSEMSEPLTVTVAAASEAETVSSASRAVGPASAMAGQEYAYSTGGAKSSASHPVEYRFIWSEGATSGWLPRGTTTAVMSWSHPGTYTDIRVEARCAEHPAIMSPLSKALHVTIAPPSGETLTTPAAPGGPARGGPGITYTYGADPSASNLGHPVEHWLHWGDGTRSKATLASPGLPLRAAKSWPSAGTYAVSVEARCSLHSSVSTFSAPVPVEIGSDSVQFSDDFGDGDALGDPDWLAHSGRWAVEEWKTLTSNSRQADNRITARALPAFRTGRLETRFRLTRSFARTPNAGIVFAYVDAEHYRYVSVLGTSIVIGQVGDTPLEPGGRKTSRRRTLPVGRWRRLAVDVRPDGEVQVFLGAEARPALTHRFADVVPGAVGYLASRAVSAFDDFIAWDETVLP